MIEDLDIIVEQRPTVRESWLLPLGMLAVTAVLVTSFEQLALLRPTTAHDPPARVSVLPNTGPANGIKSLELPRTVATAESRARFSGVTGLTSRGLNDGSPTGCSTRSVAQASRPTSCFATRKRSVSLREPTVEGMR